MNNTSFESKVLNTQRLNEGTFLVRKKKGSIFKKNVNLGSKKSHFKFKNAESLDSSSTFEDNELYKSQDHGFSKKRNGDHSHSNRSSNNTESGNFTIHT